MGTVINLSADSAINILNEMQQELYLEGDELQRMEDEGGKPLTKEQGWRVDIYFNVSCRIRKILLFSKKIPSVTEHSQPLFETHQENFYAYAAHYYHTYLSSKHAFA